MIKRLNQQPGQILAIAGLSLTFLGLAGCKHDPNKQKQKYFESGKRYEDEGKLREAVIQFSNALKVDKNFAPAHYELAKTFVQLGSMIAAYQELQRTVALNPANLQARLDLGSMLLAGGVPDKAKEQAKAVLAAQPNNAEAFALLSRVSLKAGDRTEALSQIQRAISLDPKNAKFHTALGLIDAQSPDAEAAGEAELKQAVALDQKSASPHLALASLMAKKGDFAGAQQQAQAAVQSAPKELQARAMLADLYVRGGDKAKAEQTLIQAVDDMPEKDQASDVLLNYYFRSNQPERSEVVFADLRSKHPKSLPVQISYARVLVARHEYDQAKGVLQDLSKNNGNNPQVARLNAEMLLHDGKTHDALVLLQKAVGNAPDDVRLQLLLGQTAQAMQNSGLAESSFTQASRLDPQNLDAQRGLAAVAAGRNDAGRLQELAEKAITQHPNAPDGYLWRGGLDIKQQDFTKAQQDFQQALKLDPNNSSAQLGLGELQLQQKHTAEGRALLEQALDHNPNLLSALNLLMATDLQQNQPEKALSRVQTQIGKSPNNPALYVDLAALQLRMKDYNGAQASSQKALQLNKDYEPAVQAYSQAAVAGGNTDGAIAAWQEWLKVHGGDARATMLVGTLEETKGDVNKAMDFYKKALQLDSSQAVAANNLAYLMVENGENSDVALSYAQTARRALPNSSSTADTLAWVYYHKGTYSLAKDLLEDAAKADPANASVHFHLGMTYSKLGNKSDASAQLKKAVELAPNTQTGKQAADALSHIG